MTAGAKTKRVVRARGAGAKYAMYHLLVVDVVVWSLGHTPHQYHQHQQHAKMR